MVCRILLGIKGYMEVITDLVSLMIDLIFHVYELRLILCIHTNQIHWL